MGKLGCNIAVWIELKREWGRRGEKRGGTISAKGVTLRG